MRREEAVLGHAMIYIVGIGVSGRESLTARALNAIESSGLIVGGQRHLDEFSHLRAKKLALQGGLDRAARAIKRYISSERAKGGRGGNAKVAVLATGDPNLYGIAGFIIRKFGKPAVEIIPNVSIPQEAFARIKEDWNSLKIVSAHGRESIAEVVSAASSFDRIAVFTDPVNTPAKIAGELLRRGIRGFRAYVFEAIGGRDERIIQGPLETIAKRKKFHPLNLFLLLREKGGGTLRMEKDARLPALGIPDAMFSHERGMITKSEIRAVALSKLGLRADSIVWDIGSCSGSVAIEAARVAVKGKVFAIEKDGKRIKDIEKNRKRFGISNIEIVHGKAPECLKGLTPPPPPPPPPDAVFIGGGGDGVVDILKYSSRVMKPGSTAVVNAVTMETAGTVFDFFKKKGWGAEAVLISLSRTKELPGGRGSSLNMLLANNPVFIITGRKP